MSTGATGSSGFVTSDDLRLHYLAYGSGEPSIVVVPGITSPAITWQFVAEPLAKDHQVVVLDVRGRGESDKPKSGFELPDYARDVKALVTELRLEQPVVLGHSMGARIAAAFGVLHPEVAGPLLLVEPPLTGPGRPVYPTSLEAFIDQLEKASEGATVEELRPYFPTWSDDQLQLRLEVLPTCDETAVRESWLNFHREDVHEYLERIRPPALFIYGMESPVVTRDAVDEVERLNRRLEIIGIERAGHMIPWDNLEDFLSETTRFLKDTS